MATTAKLKLGYIPYLNCVPFFYFLKDCGFQGDYISGVPAELNRMLQCGQLDISPSSSFEYARNWQEYVLLPQHSIASRQQVKSVLLFSPVDISLLEGQHVAITAESATSINLMRIIFREFYHLENVSDGVPEENIEKMIGEGYAALLIGDRALRLAENCPSEMKIFDLGEVWYRYTGLPFVFALWMICRQSLDLHADKLSQIAEQLLHSRRCFEQQSAAIAKKIAGKIGLSVETIMDYWQTIDYTLADDHLRSLELFFALCCKYQLLEEEPQLNFWHAQQSL